MKEAPKLDHFSLNTLVHQLREGRYVIPDFQREFEWKPSDIRELMRSIFLDYYIGSLLLWDGIKENIQDFSCEPIYGYEGKGKPGWIILDGQQRLTAIYYAFFAPDIPLPGKSNRFFYFIYVDKFMAEQYDEAFGYEWGWDKVLNDKHAQYEKHIFPLAIIGAGRFDLPNWLQNYEIFWQNRAQQAASSDDEAYKEASKHVSNAKAFGQYIEDITEEYQISYIELDGKIAPDKVCDIFTKINSRGKRLDAFDLINALLKPKGLPLKQMWHEAESRLKDVKTEKMNVYILQVMSILRQGYCSPKYLYFLLPGQKKSVRDPDGILRKEVLVPNICDFEARWNLAIEALEDAIKVLLTPLAYGAVNSSFLPYVSILPVFAALSSHAKTIPAHRQLGASRKLQHWYWSSVFTSRYSGSAESTSARDFLDMKAWFDDDSAEPPLIAEFAKRFRDLDLRKENKRGTSVYNGIFNLMFLHGARDWVNRDFLQHGGLDDHHIVPKSWGKEHIKDELIDSILNRTPLTAYTNRHVINDRLPNIYLREMIEQNGEKVVQSTLESHLISPNAFKILLQKPFEPEDFEAFISERQRTIQDAIETLLIKERLDLPPQLRDLDADTEEVELALRTTIEKTLGGNVHQIPEHILHKVKERITHAAKKNAAFDIERYQTLSGKLEYLDIRELQDTITSKALWVQFEPRFANKDELSKKFDQLAELRNGIRHSRGVSEIVRKEGEAAILWFKLVLSK